MCTSVVLKSILSMKRQTTLAFTKRKQEQMDEADERESSESPSKSRRRQKSKPKCQDDDGGDGDVIMTQMAEDEQIRSSQTDALNEELQKIKGKSGSSKRQCKMKFAKDQEDEYIDEKPLKLSKPKKRAKVCNVCFQIAGTPIADTGYDIIECDKCKLTAHRRCVGESVSFKEIRPTKGQPMKLFECQRCCVEKVKGAKKLQCSICSQQNGLMTKIGEDKYCHIICALMCDYYEIEDFGIMKFKQTCTDEEIEAKSKPMPGKRQGECHFCHLTDGFMLRCLKRNCKLAAHAYCIQNDRKQQFDLREKAEEGCETSIVDDEGVGWEVEFRLQDYTNQPQYSSELDKHLLIKYPGFFDNLDIVIPENSQSLGGKNRRQKPQGKKDSKSIDMLSKAGNKLHSKVNLPKRGGKVSVVCNDHRSELKICFCDNQAKFDSKQLIQCDHCKMWYHSGCVNLSKKEAHDVDSYACNKCIAWGNVRKEFILPAIGGNLDTGLLIPYEMQGKYLDWSNWQVDILPSERYRLKLLDSLIVARIWTSQAIQISEHSISAELLKQQLIRALYIPLNLQSRVALLNSKIEKVQEYEKTINDKVFNKYSLQDVKRVMSDDSMRQEENIQHNLKLAQDLRSVIEEEERVCQLKSIQCEDLELMVKVIEANLELCDIASCQDKKVPMKRLEEIKDIFEITSRVTSYKSEVRGQLEALLKEGKAFQKLIAEAVSEKAGTQIESLSDIVRQCQSKKSIQQINEKILDGKNAINVNFDVQCENISKMVDLCQKWKPCHESVDKWTTSMKELSSLQFISDVINEELKLYKENEEWIQKGLNLFDMSKRKQNTIEALDSLTKEITSKQNSLTKLFSGELKAMKRDVDSIGKQFKSGMDKEQLKELFDKAIQLSVLPDKSTFKKLKFHFKLLQWLDGEGEKPMRIEMVEENMEALSGELRDKVESKVNEGKTFIEAKLKPFKESIQKECHTIADLKNEVFQLGRQYKLLNANLRFSTKALPDYAKLLEWIDKIDYHLNKHKQKLAGKSLKEHCEIIRKDEIPKILAAYCPDFGKQSQLADDYFKALCQVRDSYCDPLTSSFLGKGKISLPKLQKLQQKCQSSKDSKYEEVTKQVLAVNQWYTDFKSSLPTFQSELRKELRSNPKKILDSATRLLDNQRKMRLELDANDQKLLDKCRKWSQLTVDCNTLMKDRKQTDIDLERIYEIKNEVGKIKCLDGDIPTISQVRAEFEKIEKWHEDLDKVMVFDQDRKLIKADRDLFKKLIQYAKTQIKINIDEEIKELDDQIETNENWENEARALIESTNYHKLNDARQLLDLIRRDKEQNYSLVDKILHKQLKMWLIKALCSRTDKMCSMKEFIAQVEENFNVIEEVKDEVQLIKDMQIIELSYRLQSRVMPACSKDLRKEQRTKPLERRSLTMIDCDMILSDSCQLPFTVDKKTIDKLRKDRETYSSGMENESLSLLEKISDIQKIEEALDMLKELSFISPCEQMLQKQKGKYDFIMAKVKEYPEVQPRVIVTPVKSAFTNGEENPRFFKDFEKAAKKYSKLRVQCPEGARLVKEYEHCKSQYEALKEEFAKLKLAQTFTFQNIGSINERLMCLTLDFEDDELQFRQEIWHARIAHLLKELAIPRPEKPSYRINCEQIKYWLEEGQELEVVNDQKYERLSEVVEDIDFVIRALRLCGTPEEIDEVDAAENQGLIEITHIIISVREKLKGEDSTEKHKLLAKGVIAYLKQLRSKHSSHRPKEAVEQSDESMDEEPNDDEEDEDTPQILRISLNLLPFVYIANFLCFRD